VIPAAGKSLSVVKTETISMRMRKSYLIVLPCLLVLLLLYLVFGGKGGKSTDELIGDLKTGKEKDRMICQDFGGSER